MLEIVITVKNMGSLGVIEDTAGRKLGFARLNSVLFDLQDCWYCF